MKLSLLLDVLLAQLLPFARLRKHIKDELLEGETGESAFQQSILEEVEVAAADGEVRELFQHFEDRPLDLAEEGLLLVSRFQAQTEQLQSAPEGQSLLLYLQLSDGQQLGQGSFEFLC